MSTADSARTATESGDLTERRVTPLELFFDLVFVFALTQVTGFQFALCPYSPKCLEGEFSELHTPHSPGPIGPRIASEGLRAPVRGFLHVVVQDGYARCRIAPVRCGRDS